MASRPPRRPNSGYFGKNNRKKSDKSPDYTGSLVIGQDVISALVAEQTQGKTPTLYISGWKKTSNSGDAYISLACNASQGEQQQGVAQRSAPRRNNLDDDIPF